MEWSETAECSKWLKDSESAFEDESLRSVLIMKDYDTDDINEHFLSEIEHAEQSSGICYDFEKVSRQNEKVYSEVSDSCAEQENLCKQLNGMDYDGDSVKLTSDDDIPYQFLSGEDWKPSEEDEFSIDSLFNNDEGPLQNNNRNCVDIAKSYEHINSFNSSETHYNNGVKTKRFTTKQSKLCMSRCAVLARQNRTRNKMYMENLKAAVIKLSDENEQLKTKYQKQCITVQNLMDEVTYLKQVIANESTLSHLLVKIPGCLSRFCQPAELKESTSSDESVSPEMIEKRYKTIVKIDHNYARPNPSRRNCDL